jgi:hypothetical protein
VRYFRFLDLLFLRAIFFTRAYLFFSFGIAGAWAVKGQEIVSFTYISRNNKLEHKMAQIKSEKIVERKCLICNHWLE